MYAIKTNLKVFIVSLCCLIILLSAFGRYIPTYAEENSVTYCDDMSYIDDDYNGTGTKTRTSYDVEYSYLEIELNTIISAPSYASDDTLYSNYCAPLTGLNIVVYYDRWCENLIPDYNPGMMFGNGTYHYFPDSYAQPTVDAFDSLYTLMKTNTTSTGGTTSANFKSGIKSFVENAGYNISYSSLYGTSSCVNMNKMQEAVADGKVGLLMCSRYNFVLGITNNENENKVHVTKTSSTAGHMMMVYGIKKYRYYNESNVNFRTDTFLLASSSYASADQGYILMDNDLTIDEAYVVSIS